MAGEKPAEAAEAIQASRIRFGDSGPLEQIRQTGSSTARAKLKKEALYRRVDLEDLRDARGRGRELKSCP